MQPSDRSNLIYDVGAHQGEDTGYYLRKGFNVVAIEASPKLAAQVRDRFPEDVNSGRLTVLNVAITSQPGRVRFFENTQTSYWGTTQADWADRNVRLGSPSDVIEVEGVPFESVLAQFGLAHYLKIDIEGSDLLCLEALRSFGSKPRYLSLESTKTSWDDLVAEFDLMQSLGYQRFKVVAQHEVTQQIPPHPPLEGLFTDEPFEFGASGQFGAEAPGEWMSRDEALAAYYPIFMTYALFGDDGLANHNAELRAALSRYIPLPEGVGWYDTHAMLG
jgi:FkbM family methyltransferase